jgi:hypothetical protein
MRLIGMKPQESRSRPIREGGGGSETTIAAGVKVSLAPSQVMPSLTEDEYAALRDHITTNGALVPILVDQHGVIMTATTAPK